MLYHSLALCSGAVLHVKGSRAHLWLCELSDQCEESSAEISVLC